jgi:hypothetical protein
LIFNQYESFNFFIKKTYPSLTIFLYFISILIRNGGFLETFSYIESLPKGRYFPIRICKKFCCIQYKPSKYHFIIILILITQNIIIPIFSLISIIFNELGYFNRGVFALDDFFIYYTIITAYSTMLLILSMLTFFSFFDEKFKKYYLIFKFFGIQILVISILL